jgi:hypothetical protein
MKQYIASLAGVSPYFQSRSYDREIERLPKEGPDAYEERTWRHRTHINDDGQIVIPAESIQASIRYGAAYLSEKIPGRGSEKWTKHFASGVLIPDGIVLPERRETVQGQWLHMNANGRAGSGTRVWRCMPFIPRWAGDVTIYVLDDIITDDILKRVIEHAGQFIGIGQNRPQVGGTRGRFQLVELVSAAGEIAPRLAAE